ncbi:RNA polymerase sigma factor [Robbsia andropogonis]|nr:sigma-70 family RNA polymerase sigma factor [Robbsia andropogonis]MCP1121534.1 sigma-70 family RNA polymerase sigma factor [Robbsia andropogonis]MCP1131353.1 sigma-70 family RNA polymerase sigma factor [Robbsia andropogonis]
MIQTLDVNLNVDIFWSSPVDRPFSSALQRCGARNLSDINTDKLFPAIIFVDCTCTDSGDQITKLLHRGDDQCYLIAVQRDASAERIVSLIASGANDVVTEIDLLEPEPIISRARDQLRLMRFARDGVANFSALQSHADGMVSPVYFKDANGLYMGCNDIFENFLDMHRSAIVGKTVYEVSPSNLAVAYHKADLDLLEKGGVQVYVTGVRNGAGDVRAVRFHKGVVYDDNGEITGIVGAMLEIGDHRAYEIARNEIAKVTQQISTTAPGLHNQPNTMSHERWLVDCVGRGDSSALARLYHLHRRRITRFLSRLTWKSELQNEIVNDAFMVVWRKAKDFRGDSSVSTWITSIAYRCALQTLRNNRRDEFELLDTELMIQNSPDYDLSDILSKALDLLPEEQRVTMTLAYILGHSVEEIARITDCPVTTVKARMHRARAKLRVALNSLGG